MGIPEVVNRPCGVMVPCGCWGAHVPSPRRKVVLVAPVPLFNCWSEIAANTAVAGGRQVDLRDVCSVSKRNVRNAATPVGGIHIVSRLRASQILEQLENRIARSGIARRRADTAINRMIRHRGRGRLSQRP